MADKKKTDADKPTAPEPELTIVIKARVVEGMVQVKADLQTANGTRYGAAQNADSGRDVMRAAKEIMELLAIQTHQQDVLDAMAQKYTQPDFKPLQISSE